jgi:hypothetical protein
MNVTIAAPTKAHHYRPRHDWAPLTAILDTAQIGTLVCVPLADLPTGPIKATQGALHGIARRRGLRISTRVEDESLFILLAMKTTVERQK